MLILKGFKLPKISGITLFPFIILRDKFPSAVLINHEKIHIRQQLEMLILPFYVWYIVEWLLHYLQVKNFWLAYQMISFERESYEMESNLSYLKNRKFWAFLSYL